MGVIVPGPWIFPGRVLPVVILYFNRAELPEGSELTRKARPAREVEDDRDGVISKPFGGALPGRVVGGCELGSVVLLDILIATMDLVRYKFVWEQVSIEVGQIGARGRSYYHDY